MSERDTPRIVIDPRTLTPAEFRALERLLEEKKGSIFSRWPERAIHNIEDIIQDYKDGRDRLEEDFLKDNPNMTPNDWRHHLDKPRPGQEPEMIEPDMTEQNGNTITRDGDPRIASMVALASTPVTNPGQSALLKRTETLTQPEMMDLIQSAQGDFAGWRSGDPQKARLYQAAQDWHSFFYGDGEQRLDGGKPITPAPIVAIPTDPAPHATADGNDLWQASARMGSKVALASDADGYDGAVKGLQRGLNMLNDANPEIRRSKAWGDYTKQEKIAEDGLYGPQTDFGMKQALSRHGEDKVDGALALGRFNVFARQAGQDGNADGLEAKTASLFGDQAGRPLQKTLNRMEEDTQNNWQPLVEDNWIGPKTAQAFAGLMGDTDPDSFTQSFGQGLGLL